MRMPKTNEHGDVFLRVRIYESVRTTIIRQSNSIQNRQHTTRDSLGYHVFTN
jgi:hypothetical protein